MNTRRTAITRGLALFIVLAGGCSLFAQDVHQRFRLFTGDSGLSQVSIHCLMEDRGGFLWVGTTDGLNRFDGYEFRIFRHDPNDPNSIGGTQIFSLSEDRDGRIWIATRNQGLSCFDPRTERFENIRHIANMTSPSIRKILADDGHLWIASAEGLYRMEMATHRFELMAEELGPVSINDLDLDASGQLWFVTAGGLYKLDERGSVAHLETRDLQCVAVSDAGTIWVGDAQRITKLNGEGQSEYEIALGDESGGTLNRILKFLYPDREEGLWIGTNVGLRFLPAGSRESYNYERNPNDPHGILAQNIFCALQNRRGQIWVGTNNGLHQRDPREDRFGLYYLAPFQPYVIDGLFVIKDHRDTLWLSTYNMGLLTLKPDGTLTQFDVDLPSGISLKQVRVNGMLEDNDRHLWLGISQGGLIRLDEKRQFVSHFFHSKDPNSLSHNSVIRLYEDSNGILWVGTLNGLNRYDAAANKFHRVASDPEQDQLSHHLIQDMLQHPEGSLWVATQNGLNLMQADGRIKHYFHELNQPRSLSHSHVSDLLYDSNGILWLGTSGGGINRYNKSTDNFVHYTSVDGLGNSNIYRILEDDDGHLWMSTNHGLSRFDPLTETFHNFDRDDGLQDNEFNPAAFKDKDGRLYFAGLRGVNMFHPRDIRLDAPNGQIMFTDFRLFNKSVSVGTDSPLPQAIHRIPRLELDSDQDLMSLGFSSMSFSESSKISYAYKLDGHDREWIAADPVHRLATYSRLSGGDYQFRVKCTNEDGNWNPDQAVLSIRVLPPFWRSVDAYLLYGLVALGLIWLFVYLLRRDVNLERKAKLRLEREVEQQTLALRSQVVELETLDKIVQHINRDVSLERVTYGILQQGVSWFPEADDGVLLLKDDGGANFRLVTQAGVSVAAHKEETISETEVGQRFVNSELRVAEGLYLCIRGSDPPFPLVPKARSLIAITLDYQETMVGLLLISSNEAEPETVSAPEIGRLSRFRAHVTTAFAKAKTMNQLVLTQQQLMETARHAGMAEIATAVLHNVGNILNSVITSSQMIRNSLENTRLEGLQRAGEMVRESGLEPRDFFAQDPRALDLFCYLLKFEKPFQVEREANITNANRVIKRVEDIRSVIMAQQSYASMGSHLEDIDLIDLIENAINMMLSSISRHRIQVVRDFLKVPSFQGERTKLIHIFVNLIKNAIEAMSATPYEGRLLFIRVRPGDESINVRVKDRGEGIAEINRDRIFQHGFTTKETGHGFGLHSVANSLNELGGTIQVIANDDGPGVCFELVIPLERKARRDAED